MASSGELLARIAERPSVLIADDNIAEARWLYDYCVQHNAKADVVYSGEDAVKKLVERPYEILVLDLKMPRGDGVYVLESIKSNRLTLQRIIIITGLDEASGGEEAALIQAAKRYGPMTIVPKPLSVDKVAAVLFNCHEPEI